MTDSEHSTENLTYEQARAELVATVERLEAGGATLEESLRLWERGEALADLCQSHLEGARKRLEARTAAESED
ncbi:MAG TPA: exodeoxyribonuclease VII small subunit [Glycomyces sp.]|nr:exodeoxyribonuclease VII small subunit [Glycomyces sp.]